ncbi:MAG TPA: DUF835 domain-containing protein [Thermoplasmata archaeon]|nr:DUF835 domain-containing protein [Thermoplasmata archaeon]
MESLLQVPATGGIVLVDERKPDLSYRLLQEQSKARRPVLCVTREPPERISRRYPMETAAHVWLITGNGGRCVNPSNLAALRALIARFLERNRGGAVLIDGIELLMIMNSYEDVRKFLCALQSSLLRANMECLIPIDTRTLTAKELLEMRTAFPMVRGAASE